jgi:SM-20-related protein
MRPDKSNLERSPYCRIENFMSERENRHLLKVIYKRMPCLETSETTTGEPNYRKSLVFYPDEQCFPGLLELIESCIPFVTRALGRKPFHIREIDIQVTAHNDGDYFKIHSDSGGGRTRSRSISFVYYLHRLPKPFTGGELILYRPAVHKSIITIEPINNSMLFFRSEQEHSIQRVRCRTRKFEDSRFTINGWICR